MANGNKTKLSIVSAVLAFISLMSIYLIPISIYEWSGEKEYWKLMDGFVPIIKYIPIILLAGIIVFSLLEITIAMFICSLCYVTLGIAVISFTLKYSKPYFGLAIIVIEMVLIAILAIIQLKKTLAIRKKDINMELAADEKLIIKGEKQGVGAATIGFIVAIIFGVVLFAMGCNLADSYLTVSAGKVCIAFSVIIIVASIIGLLYFGNCIIFVTDKRVCGKASFNKRIDLPLDSITAVSDIPTFHGVAVATSSGRIKFYYLQNSGAVYSSICKLLVERQSKDTLKDIPWQQHNDLDDLVKLKKLLDDGIITQEEFDAKKKQLLGL